VDEKAARGLDTLKQKLYVDLHLHLDGAITPEIARKLAKLQDLSLPEDEKELQRQLSVPSDCRSLNDFLQCFALPLSLMQTKKGIEAAVSLVQEAIKKDGIVYSEIRFAPQLHCEQGLSQEEVVLAALKGLAGSDLKCNLILCCMRGTHTREANLETLRLAEKYQKRDGGIAALDLAGAEGLYPTKDYQEIFLLAKEKGIPFTIHAGEADGAQSVRTALEFGASRIGHGVRAMEEEELLEQLAKNQICLEMCPTSNRQTKAVADMKQYPLVDFLKRGICVTINTDDMAISRTDIQKEFRYVEETFGISRAQRKTMIKNAIRSAFAVDAWKEELYARMEEEKEE
jgi:adenosine deaminase